MTEPIRYGSYKDCLAAATAATRATGLDHVTVLNTETGEWLAVTYAAFCRLPNAGWAADARLRGVSDATSSD